MFKALHCKNSVMKLDAEFCMPRINYLRMIIGTKWGSKSFGVPQWSCWILKLRWHDLFLQGLFILGSSTRTISGKRWATFFCKKQTTLFAKDEQLVIYKGWLLARINLLCKRWQTKCSSMDLQRSWEKKKRKLLLSTHSALFNIYYSGVRKYI